MTKANTVAVIGDYEIITKPFTPKPLPKNCYEFRMDCYFGDLDGTEKYNYTIPKDPILLIQTVLELYIFKNQFPNGRGGVRAFYDQTQYLRNINVDYAETDNYWEWLADYPYHSDIEQNYTLDEFQILSYDNESKPLEIEVKIPDKFIQVFDNNNTAFFQTVTRSMNDNDLEKEFAAYRQMVVSLIEQELLKLKIATPSASISTKNKQKI